MWLLFICAFLITPSIAYAGWKSDRGHKGQVKRVEERFPSQGGRVVEVARTFFNRDGQPIKRQLWAEFEGVPRGNTASVITHIQEGETSWSMVQEEDAVRPSGISFSRPTETHGRIEGFVLYIKDGVFSQLHLRYFDSCGEITQDFSYLSYPPFLFQKEMTNHYATDCQLTETDIVYRGRTRAVTKYDTLGRPVETMWYELSGTPIQEEIFKYNSQGDLVEEEILLPERVVKRKVAIEYQYDAVGNWIKRTSKVLIENGQPVEGQVGMIFRSFMYFDPTTLDDK